MKGMSKESGTIGWVVLTVDVVPALIECTNCLVAGSGSGRRDGGARS